MKMEYDPLINCTAEYQNRAVTPDKLKSLKVLLETLAFNSDTKCKQLIDKQMYGNSISNVSEKI